MTLFVVRKQSLLLQVPKKMVLQVANELFAVSIWIGNRVILFLIWRRKTFGSVDSDLTLSHSQMHLSQLVARKGKRNVRRRSPMKRTYKWKGFTVCSFCFVLFPSDRFCNNFGFSPWLPFVQLSWGNMKYTVEHTKTSPQNTQENDRTASA